VGRNVLDRLPVRVLVAPVKAGLEDSDVDVAKIEKLFLALAWLTAPRGTDDTVMLAVIAVGGAGAAARYLTSRRRYVSQR
jgi:hypothetical protein